MVMRRFSNEGSVSLLVRYNQTTTLRASGWSLLISHAPFVPLFDKTPSRHVLSTPRSATPMSCPAATKRQSQLVATGRLTSDTAISGQQV
jgi:hypothetical protein